MIHPQPYLLPFELKKNILIPEYSTLHSSGIFESKMYIVNAKKTNALEKYLTKSKFTEHSHDANMF